jgi:single-strand DNA-binding protein
LNRVVLIGNLTRDPDLRTGTNTGTAICNFTLAVARRFKRDETDFIPVVTFKATAESCAKFLRKGSQAAVTGSLQTRTYDAKDGTKRYVTEVIADEVQFLSKRDTEQTESGAPDMGAETDDELPF